MTDPLGDLRARLRLPLIAAPMFLVSGPALVTAACRAGVIGAFPTANCRSGAELDAWLTQIADAIKAHEDETGRAAPPYCPNLIVHRSNPRLDEDLRRLIAHRPEVVITSVGTPAPVLAPLRDVGARVLADVATLRHAEKAIAAGADGLVLLTAGAGGQTGWLNPFAFVRAVRRLFDGVIVLAGGISDGHALRAAQVLGADLAYMGTRFIATRESLAPDAYKQMLVEASADDIVLTRAITGLETNILGPSLVRVGLDPAKLPARGAIDVGRDISAEAREAAPSRWKDVWSAGHTVSGVTRVLPVAELVAETEAEYRSSP